MAGAGAGRPGRPAAPEESLQQGIMHVACAWVAMAREETASQVDITPLGGGTYECAVALASGAPGVLLRVAFKLDGELRLAVSAEPVRPG